MKTLMFAALSLVTMLAITGGNATPSADAAAPPASLAPGCTAVCFKGSFPTLRECIAACPLTGCDVICS